jgi:hypothetical protein
MLPRIASAQFGLFDDGATLRVSRAIWDGEWSPSWEEGRGRFRPFYWIYHALVYRVAGEKPQIFFAGNAVLFAATTAGLIYLVHLNGGTPLQAVMSGLLYALSGPAVENSYTLSKPEHIQVFWLLTGFLLVSWLPRLRASWQRAVVSTLLFLSAFMALISKETSLIMLPLGVCWLVSGWGYRRLRWASVDLQGRLYYLVTFTLASAGFFLARSFYISGGLAAQGYSGQYDFNIRGMLAAAVRWAGWLLRDYAYLIPILLIILVWILVKKRISETTIYVDLAIWMGAWVVIYLPWIYTQEYYLLPFALGAAAFSGLAVGEAVTLYARWGRSGRFFTAVCLGFALVLFLITIPNNVTSARIQLAVDAVNADMLTYLAQHTPSGGMVLVNLPKTSQYIREIQTLLAELYGRGDVSIQPLTGKGIPEIESKPSTVLVASPYIDNNPLLTVRLGLYEDNVDQRQAILQEALRDVPEPVFITERGYPLFYIDVPSLVCWIGLASDYCEASVGLIDRRDFVYRWNLYQIVVPSTS